MLSFRRLSALLSLIMILTGTAITFNSHAQTAQEYRITITEIINLIDEATVVTGRTETLVSTQLAFMQLQLLTDEELLSIFPGNMPLSTLQQMIGEAQAELAHQLQSTESSPSVNTRDSDDSGIEIPNVDVDPSFCDYATGAIEFSELAVAKIAGTALSAVEFTCLQSDAGVNLAAVCVALSIVKNTADLAYENAKFCRDQQRAAKGETTLDLDRNIGAYLNTFIDDVTTSSRATQDSVDDLQTDVDTAMTSINTIQDELDSGFTSIDADLDISLSDLSSLESDLTDLIALADDIQFRVQENQVDIEDVQTRTADLQESTEEIRTDTQSIISSVTALQDELDTVLTTLNSGFNQINQDTIAAVLTRPGFNVPEYALPAAAGGQLETAREIVIQAIIELQNLSLGDTDTALSLVTLGDTAYNNAEYLTAYELFAQAYQALIVTGNGK